MRVGVRTRIAFRIAFRIGIRSEARHVFKPDLPDTAFIDPKLPGTILERPSPSKASSIVLDVASKLLEILADLVLVVTAEAAKASGSETIIRFVKSD